MTTMRYSAPYRATEWYGQTAPSRQSLAAAARYGIAETFGGGLAGAPVGYPADIRNWVGGSAGNMATLRVMASERAELQKYVNKLRAKAADLREAAVAAYRAAQWSRGRELERDYAALMRAIAHIEPQTRSPLTLVIDEGE